MFFLFLLLYKKTYDVESDSKILVTSSFGFDSGGSFDIKMNLREFNYSKIILFLSNYNRFNQERNIFNACNSSSNFKFSDLNFSYISNNKNDIYSPHQYNSNVTTGTILWNGTIDDRQIYSLWILNCDGRHTLKFLIDIQFKNKNSYIDYRDELIPQIDFIFSGIHLFLSILWFCNLFLRSEYSIPLHQIISTISLFRVLSLLIDASVWMDKKSTDVLTNSKFITHKSFITIYYTLFFASLSLVLSGYCTFREKLTRYEFFEIFASTILFIGGLNFCDDDITDLKILLISSCSMSTGFLWYLKNNFVYFVIFQNLLEQFNNNDDISKRLNLVKKYSYISLFLFSVRFFISVALAPLGSTVVDSVVNEIFLILCELCQIFFFFLLKLSIPNQNDIFDDDKGPFQIINLHDPQTESIVLIHDDEN